MKEIFGDIQSVALKIFADQPASKDSYRLIPIEANGDNGLVFEILITFLMEALVYMFKGDLTLPSSAKDTSDDDLSNSANSTSDFLQAIFTYMEPYFLSIGYELKVDTKRLIESSHEAINRVAPYRYCKIILTNENDETNKRYRFLLNPVHVPRTSLDEYYALFALKDRAYKISFC